MARAQQAANWFIGSLRRLSPKIDARRLWKRYALGLSLILISITASHYASVVTIKKAEDHSDLINETVVQRDSVDQILSFGAMTATLATAATAATLTETIDAFEASHASILRRSEERHPRVGDIYFAGQKGPALDPLVRQFVKDARLVAALDRPAAAREAALGRMQRVGEDVIPEILQEVARLLERDIDTLSGALRVVQNVTFGLALAILIGEALLIFWPAHVSVNAALNELEAAKWSVERQNEALEAMREVAEFDAHHDALTSLPNRRGFERELKRLVQETKANASNLAVFHLDLDRFKEINDRLGHSAGDCVLRHVADELRAIIAPGDVAARIGGDEFVILRESNGDRTALKALAESAIERLSRPIHYRGELCQFGASIGIDLGVACQSSAELDQNRLLANADIALYRAKELGRGRYEFFCDDLRRRVEKQRVLADDLILALRRDEIYPVYQPQYDATSGAIVGVEALVRWRHPTRGEIGPSEFLPAADQLGVSTKLDRLVLEMALADYRRWAEAFETPPSLSVNVSSAWLRDPDLVPTLRALDTPSGRFSVEILETAFTDEIDDALRFALDGFRELGVGVEVDDFGTGRASLVSLLSLNPDRLKIARELIAPLPGSERHLRLARSVVEIARSLGIAITAEGVETDQQRAALLALGCDRFQGYYYARPMPADDIAMLLGSVGDRDRRATA